jgi:hypothetical protein
MLQENKTADCGYHNAWAVVADVPLRDAIAAGGLPKLARTEETIAHSQSY